MKSSHKANESHGYWICGTCRIKYYLGSSCNKIKCNVGEDKLRQLYEKAKHHNKNTGTPVRKLKTRYISGVVQDVVVGGLF